MAKTKMKFDAKKAKSAKEIKQRSKSNNSFGNMVWIPKDGSKTLRIVAEPKDWTEYTYVMVEETDSGKKLGFRGKLPCYDGYSEDVPEAGRANPRVGWIIPVVVVEDGKPGDKVMFYEPPKKILTDLLAHFDRRKTVTDRDFDVAKEGSGRDTTYTLFAEDPKKRANVAKMGAAYLESDNPSFLDELERMVKEFMALYSDAPVDDEDDEPVKSTKKSSASKRRAMQDDEPEDDEEEDDEDDDSEEGEPEDADPDDDDDEEDEPSEVKGNFTVTEIDTAACTIDLTDAKGKTYTTVYLDRNRDDVESIVEGKVYAITLYMDDDGDWIASTAPKAVKSKK